MESLRETIPSSSPAPFETWAALRMEREETCAAIMSEASDNRTKLRELYEWLYRIDDALDRLTPRRSPAKFHIP